MNDGFAEFIGGAVVGGMLIGLIVGFTVRDTIRGDAVKAGVAEFVITQKETGATEFRFKEVK